MPRDSKQKMKKDTIHKSKRLDENARRKKKNDQSDSDDDYSSNYSEDDDDAEGGEMDAHEYRKFLAKMFPSKHMNEKVQMGNKIKQLLRKLPHDDEDSDDEEDSD